MYSWEGSLFKSDGEIVGGGISRKLAFEQSLGITKARLEPLPKCVDAKSDTSDAINTVKST